MQPIISSLLLISCVVLDVHSAEAVAISGVSCPAPPVLECSNAKGWSISEAELSDVLQEHLKWLERKEASDMEGTIAILGEKCTERKPNIGRARLCNVDLSRRMLSNRNLSYADLRGADFENAMLEKVNFDRATLSDTDFSFAVVNDASFRGADLTNAHLVAVEGKNADFSDANFNSAIVGAGSWVEDFSGADFSYADLSGIAIVNANMSGAKLISANLENSKLLGVLLTNSHLMGANLTNTVYCPEGGPPGPDVHGIRGLATLRFDDFCVQTISSEESGLIQLRELLHQAGHLDDERSITHAIESDGPIVLSETGLQIH